MSNKVLIVVHPGSLCSPAVASLGRNKSESLRGAILLGEIADHKGDLIIIDNSLSIELREREVASIESALDRAEEGSHLALHLWACDTGDVLPEEDFKPRSVASMSNSAVFASLEDAVAEFADLIKGKEITVTGGWVDGDSPNVTVVAKAIKDVLGKKAIVEVSEEAACEELPEEDNDLEDIDGDE
jgi:hypothetical protein